LSLWGALSDERSCQSLSAVIVHRQVSFTRHTFEPRLCRLHCKSSHSTWTVVRLTATRVRPLKFPMSGFALPYIADIVLPRPFYAGSLPMRRLPSSCFAKTFLCVPLLPFHDNNENNTHLQLSCLRRFYLHCLVGHKSYQLINTTQKPTIS
jgi:hypothetical protein